jgi:hypothetical protein
MTNRIGSLAISLLVACSSAPRDDGARAQDVEGRYVWGAEVETFQPCGDSLTYWVESLEPVWRRLRAEHQALTKTPYQAVIVRVHGNLSDAPRDGFALDYDGLFRIDSVVSVSATIPAACELKEQ